jgi:uncharacterized protein (DUF1330 family)
MSAYVIVEFTVKDPDVVREKYSPNAAQTVKEHGGEVLAANVDREILYGDPLFRSGVLIRFPTMRRLSDGTNRLNISS